MGNPVAFEARAEDRETRGFISITSMRPSSRIDGKLHIRTASFHADFAQHCYRCIAHDLIFLIGQRLRGRDGDGVACVNAHRIEVFDGADNNAIVFLVAYDFHLEFFPADDRFLDQQFLRRRSFQSALADIEKFLAVIGDAATGAAHSK